MRTLCGLYPTLSAALITQAAACSTLWRNPEAVLQVRASAQTGAEWAWLEGRANFVVRCERSYRSDFERSALEREVRQPRGGIGGSGGVYIALARPDSHENAEKYCPRVKVVS